MSHRVRGLGILAASALICFSGGPGTILHAGPGPAAVPRPSGMHDLTAFTLVVEWTASSGRTHRIQAKDPTSASWTAVGLTGVTKGRTEFELDRRFMYEDGSLRLRIGDRHRIQDGWVWLASTPASTRGSALASARVPLLVTGRDWWGFLTLGLTSHLLVPRFATDGTLNALSVDGAVTAGAAGTVTATVGLGARGSSWDGDVYTARFVHGGANPLTMTVAKRGDRLRYSFAYRVVEPIDQAVSFVSSFDLGAPLASLETLSWRPATESTVVVDPAEPLVMAEFPFVVARRADGTYLGVLDRATSSLVSRFDPASESLDVELWAWPSRVGQRYRWSFDLLAGSEPYANAFLRALHPYTKHFHSSMEGGLHTRYSLDSLGRAEQAYADGVRFIWLHGWWYRNGLYFVDGQPMNEQYTSIWGDTWSYDRLRTQVETAHAAGLQAFVYIQFAGVSEDVTAQFEPIIVRDAAGEQVVAGRDGQNTDHPIRNILANANPTGRYGRSLVDQVDRLLGAIRPDGIALDRPDRLQLSDYGGFDGYASPPLDAGGPDPLPVSNLARQGKRLFLALRATADRHGAKLISNVPITPLFFRKSDATKADLPMTPWTMFFMRASANGKTYFMHDRTEYPGSTPLSKGADNVFLGRLARAQPFVTSYAWESDLYPFTGHITNSRLQYVVPTGAGYPDLWLFADGSTMLRWDPAQASTRGKFAGSRFVPWPASLKASSGVRRRA
jgi:hypothetical protein